MFHEHDSLEITINMVSISNEDQLEKDKKIGKFHINYPQSRNKIRVPTCTRRHPRGGRSLVTDAPNVLDVLSYSRSTLACVYWC